MPSRGAVEKEGSLSTIQELMEKTGVPVVIADHQGFITHVNEPFQVVFGWPSEEIIGKPLTVLMPKTFHDAHHLGFSRFLVTEKATLLNRPLRLKALTKSGREFDAEHTIIAEHRHGEWVFGATIRPLGGE